jgi:hypothetical protein
VALDNRIDRLDRVLVLFDELEDLLDDGGI